MKKNEFLREFVEEMVVLAANAGIELTTDTISLTLVYPHLPGIEVNLSVGGMFTNAQLESEEELH